MRPASAMRLFSSIASQGLALSVLTGDRSILGYGEIWPNGLCVVRDRGGRHATHRAGKGFAQAGKLAASLIRRFPSIQKLTQIKVAHVDQRQVRCEAPKIGSCPNKTALEGAHVRRRSGGRPREAVLSVWRVSRARKCIIRRYSRARLRWAIRPLA
jgi:hypothetical protein